MSLNISPLALKRAPNKAYPRAAALFAKKVHLILMTQHSSQSTMALAILCLSLLVSSCAWLATPHSNSSVTAQNRLPETCRSDCATPYGEWLGVARGNVPAFSNCNAECVVFDPNKLNGTFTGIKWQCVEFARRWLLAEKGTVFEDVDTASDLWRKVQSLIRISDGKRIPLDDYLNGSSEPPQVGDLIIYAKEYFDTGHVAVVTKVELKNGSLDLAEQNFLNQKWPGDYARRVGLVQKDGRHWVLDAYVLGWKRMRSSP
jgi:hypothetical protein